MANLIYEEKAMAFYCESCGAVQDSVNYYGENGVGYLKKCCQCGAIFTKARDYKNFKNIDVDKEWNFIKMDKTAFDYDIDKEGNDINVGRVEGK